MNIAAYCLIGISVIIGILTAVINLRRRAYPRAAMVIDEEIRKALEKEPTARFVIIDRGNRRNEWIIGFVIAQIFFDAGIAFWIGYLQGLMG